MRATNTFKMLDVAFYALKSANLACRDGISESAYTNKDEFLLHKATIKFCPGRMTYKTSWICQQADENDLIISTRDLLNQGQFNSTSTPTASVCSLIEAWRLERIPPLLAKLTNNQGCINTVFIDNGIYMHDEEMEIIYSVLSRLPNTPLIVWVG